MEQADHDATGDAGVSSSAVDQAVRQILDLIRNRAMSIGDVLPTERELCELFESLDRRRFKFDHEKPAAAVSDLILMHHVRTMPGDGHRG